MAFPLVTVLTTAPGLISAAADIIRVIKERKTQVSTEESPADSAALQEMVSLIEKQALVIEEIALNNQQLTLAVRNNRILSVLSLVVAIIAMLLAL